MVTEQQTTESLREEQETLQKENHTPITVALALRFPFSSLFAFLLLAILASVRGLGFFSLTDPLAGLRIRDDYEAMLSDGWEQSLYVTPYESVSADISQQAERSRSFNEIVLMYFAPGDPRESGDIFTLEGIQAMKDAEEAITGASNYTQYCLRDLEVGGDACTPPYSPLKYLGNATTQEELNQALWEMYQLRDSVIEPTRYFFATDFAAGCNITRNEDNAGKFSVPEGCKFNSFLTRSVIRMGTPLPGYANRNSNVDEQNRIVKTWLDENVRDSLRKIRQVGLDDDSEPLVLFVNSQLFGDEILEIMFGDLMWTGASLLFVLVLLTFHTRSFFLGFMGILQVLLSFPVCFFMYRVVLGLKLFGGLQIISLYIVVGIGCDDIVIYTDALKQSKVLLDKDTSFAERLSWSFKRSKFTMLSTTLTTVLAFLTLTFSTVPVIRYFGVFAALLVLLNFLLVTTIYTSTLVIFHKYLESNTWGVRKHEGQLGLGYLEEFFHNRIAKQLVTVPFRRRMVLCFALPILITLVAFATQLQPAAEAIDFWPIGHQFRFYFDNSDSFQATQGQAQQQLHMVWGLEAPFIDRTGTDETVESDKGDPIFYPVNEFNVADPEAQIFLRDVCYEVTDGELADELFITQNKAQDIDNAFNTLSNSTRQVNSIPASCVMAAFALWREELGLPFPVPIPTNQVSDPRFASLDAVKGETFEEAFFEFLSRPQFGFRFSNHVGLSLGGGKDGKRLRVQRLFQSFDVDATGEDSNGKRQQVYNAWKKVIQDFNTNPDAPSLGDTQVTDSFYFVWMITQNLFTFSALLSVALSLGLAFGITALVSQNIVVALLTTLCMLFIVVSVGGLMNIIGWQLGSIESVCITVLVGFSVDYLIHIAIAYTEVAESKVTRDQRVTHALTTMGVSVLAGALSTLGASSFLLFTTITFFTQFGTFMVMAVATALIFGIILFPALLAEFGPEGDTGMLKGMCFSSILTRPTGHTRASTVPTEVAKLDEESQAAKFDEESQATLGNNSSSTTSVDNEDNVGDSSNIPSQEASKSNQVMDAAEPVEPAEVPFSEPKQQKEDQTQQSDSKIANKAALLYFGLIAVFIVLVFVFEIVEQAREASKQDSDDVTEFVDTSEVIMPTFSELKPAGEWNVMQPGGETICARGTDYAFFVRKGSDPSKVIIEFQGGGGCWSLATCQTSTKTFTDNVDSVRDHMQRVIDGTTAATGLADKDSPYANYTHILISYCSADLHWGNNVVQYTDSLKIHHRGAVNARSALDWVKEQVPTPDRILVTGCSAGAYGSILWSAHLAQYYAGVNPSTRIVQLGDGGLGVVTPEFMSDAFPNWKVLGADGSFPTFVIPPELGNQVDPSQLDLAKLYNWTARAQPLHTFSQFSSAYDWNQAFFFKTQKVGFGGLVSGTDLTDWNTAMRELYSNATLESMPANYKHLIGNGDYHCNVPMDRHWWVKGGGITPLYQTLFQMFELNEPEQVPTVMDCALDDQVDCLEFVDLRNEYVYS